MELIWIGLALGTFLVGFVLGCIWAGSRAEVAKQERDNAHIVIDSLLHKLKKEEVKDALL